ncbi:MAG: hypothetical protein QOG31_25, partial [Thermoplasmata archaeon]|nr:hypothetical protein [Thermoplasmata archaeon]
GPNYAQTYAAVAGGNVTVGFPEAPGAQVDLVYRSGAPTTHGQLDAAGSGTFHATNATFAVQVTHDNATWTREAFVPAGTPAADATLHLTAASPRQSTERVGLDTGFYRWFWLPALAAAFVAAGGYFAFRLRAPRLALAGAFLFLLGSGLMVAVFGPALLTLSFVGTAALGFAFIYRARTLFTPLRAPRAPPAPPTPPT